MAVGGVKEKHVRNMGDWLDIDFLVELWGWAGPGVLSSNPDLLSVVIHDVWRVGAITSSPSSFFLTFQYAL